MQQAVQFQLSVQKSLVPGDVILSNHSEAGGSHLPDLTVITPVFIDSDNKPSFFIANRGHHADIGGLTPGSMPPMSTSINEEGAIFRSFKIVSAGDFQESALIAHLNEPAKHPGCTGTQNLSDNLADLHAQIAANVRGSQLVKELIEEYSFPRVLKYMN
ncbi:Oidioi.mRNA.OKI2018_I69.YSR.g17179.t1.cds [Oikopleura dioica]|uniref:Oidioi.mRNA.OKI2018_I69.YSR.g17179.t1.cds n=1 Tax=Oikopleura dioica TaxID=34765 RepID=A0ABN7SM80_OIKDI|nr:Oidioi.mRNA.OKI2018_I69.YSR.g17179.t1.cds [Oikopleura dioica]